MLAIGFLSLLGLGVVAMASGGGDDSIDQSDQDQTQDLQEDLPPQMPLEDSVPEAPAPQDPAPADDDAPATQEEIEIERQARINAFLEQLNANPSDDDEELFIAFLEELEAELAAREVADETPAPQPEPEPAPQPAPEQPEDVASEEEESVARPPMGDEFRDPLLLAEEMEEQRIIEEIEAEAARTPENLVTVNDRVGAEISDDQVLSTRPDDADPSDPAFVVTAPETSNDIEVGYDAEHTFLIQFNEETDTVTAGLNSNTDGPEGQLVRSITNEPDDRGINVRTLSWIKEFRNSTDITIEVNEDHIGDHVAQIDLSNPNDVVHFDFASDVTGNLHLIYDESEEGDEGDTNTIKRAFVIRTASDVTSLSAQDVAALVAAENGQVGSSQILSEVFLGNESFVLLGDPQGDEPYEIRMRDYINTNPQITANVAWASEGEVDSSAEPQGTGGGGSQGGFPTLDFPTLTLPTFGL